MKLFGALSEDTVQKAIYLANTLYLATLALLGSGMAVGYAGSHFKKEKLEDIGECLVKLSIVLGFVGLIIDPRVPAWVVIWLVFLITWASDKS